MAGLDVEGGVPGVDVAHYAVHAEFGGTLDVGQDLIAQRLFAIERAEGLSPA